MGWAKYDEDIRDAIDDRQFFRQQSAKLEVSRKLPEKQEKGVRCEINDRCDRLSNIMRW